MFQYHPTDGNDQLLINSINKNNKILRNPLKVIFTKTIFIHNLKCDVFYSIQTSYLLQVGQALYFSLKQPNPHCQICTMLCNALCYNGGYSPPVKSCFKWHCFSHDHLHSISQLPIRGDATDTVEKILGILAHRLHAWSRDEAVTGS